MIYLIIWIVCGVLSYGMLFAYFQREYPEFATKSYRKDMSTSMLLGLLGPFALLVSLGMTGFAKHGIKFK